MGSKATLSDIISADKIFGEQKFSADKNFRRQARFSALLSAEIFSDKVYLDFDKKISFRRNNRQLTSYFLSEKGCQYILEKIRASFILGLYNAGLYLAFTSIFTSLRRF